MTKTIKLIQDFLSLPVEVAPTASYVDGSVSDAVAMLRDFCLPEKKQQFNHIGEGILLMADVKGWRRGIVVNAG